MGEEDLHSVPLSDESTITPSVVAVDTRIDDGERPMGDGDAVVRPPSHLPRPEAPRGLSKARSIESKDLYPLQRSVSEHSSVDVSSITKYLRDRGNSLSSAIGKWISSFREGEIGVKEFQLSGLKVTVLLKDEEENGVGGIKGRVSFFSRSNYRDCGAVRSFFRERSLPYVEINVDVFPEREAELVERAGSSSVSAIFFNEKLLGGLVVLNSLRNSEEFDQRLREMTGAPCPEAAPRPPGFDYNGGGENLAKPQSRKETVKNRSRERT